MSEQEKSWPSVGVVVPTHRRPQQLRDTLDAILTQDYPGEMHIVVVFDRAKPDESFVQDGPRSVRVTKNLRTPGLAGARNTGIDALGTDLIAFCDDDDVWLPGRLRRQVAALSPNAELVTCAVEVAYEGAVVPRLAGMATIRHVDLLRSRMMMLHSSTFLLRRAALLGGLGMVAEDAPGSQNEDWDLLLRAARRAPITHVDEPLVRVHWGNSHFAARYDTKISSLHWMLSRHPELHGCPQGAARVYGQLACWHAAVGQRKDALQWARRAMRSKWTEPRAVIATAAAVGLVRIETVMSALHRKGHGI
ncbi:glycosyltransferase family 2 protein [Phytomonospora endophytica]|uniref:Glycosyltransferase involved in cell wall biosynthesis n=1 Tax=Phytomonospora endophytica TaxID=714109 RepID=A0A841F8G9_9ACTN|nr:glycosyltransferase [Phytomonospora endophytica]MBB6033381.1 glycosyltransferase involved in cell wall biosynthesis [Phytomonospora endophytica]GIG70848.1 glycosyl transferase [Phytomonospora endophytica]